MAPGIGISGLRRGNSMIKMNLSKFDRVLRISIGLMLVYIGFIDTALIGDAYLAGMLGILGLVNLGAGVIAYCPLYRLAGINTRPPA
ncbi:MAG: hypothetical protein BMS9Abin08_1315 [Gammaproteobacteria bacterium]|nr:MAG: hypothetical protein BMS9Abin08_1315 [Gammaproteobacteria bacterium]